MHSTVLLGDVGRVEARFDTFGDKVCLAQDRCTVCAIRTKGLEVVVDALDGTPRSHCSSRSSFRYVWRQCLYNIGARFAPYILKAWKLFWMHSSIQLGNAVRQEVRFDTFRDNVCLGTR